MINTFLRNLIVVSSQSNDKWLSHGKKFNEAAYTLFKSRRRTWVDKSRHSTEEQIMLECKIRPSKQVQNLSSQSIVQGSLIWAFSITQMHNEDF